MFGGGASTAYGILEQQQDEEPTSGVHTTHTHSLGGTIQSLSYKFPVLISSQHNMYNYFIMVVPGGPPAWYVLHSEICVSGHVVDPSPQQGSCVVHVM